MFVWEITKRYLGRLVCKRPDSVHQQLKPVIRLLGDEDVERLRGYHLSDYRQIRRDEGVADSTINRELAFLRAAFNCALDDEVIQRAPRFRLVRENNTRDEFCTETELYKLIEHLPFPLQDLIEFLFWSGWRKAEVLGLVWDDVQSDMIVLKQKRTKASRGRILPLVGPIGEIIKRRRSAQIDASWVFHWGDGRPIRDFRASWKRACEKADLNGLRVHDLRRSLAHHHLQRGIPQAVTMKLAGWKTDSMYRRYAIVDVALLSAAVNNAMSTAQQLDENAAPQSGAGCVPGSPHGPGVV